jgi:hypothetical protein
VIRLAPWERAERAMRPSKSSGEAFRYSFDGAYAKAVNKDGSVKRSPAAVNGSLLACFFIALEMCTARPRLNSKDLLGFIRQMGVQPYRG